MELQKKYSKDKERLAREQARIYREAGINPLGCLWPLLIQFPIWIAVYQAVIRALAATPEELFNLSKYLYSLSFIHQLVPLREHFLWLNLAQPDRSLILPLLVGGSLWVQQKMTAVPTADPRQQSMNNMMLWLMPMMFALFTLQFASGLALYWATFNIIGIIIQYFISGWGGLKPSKTLPPPKERGLKYGKPGVQRQERGRSHPESTKGTGIKKGRGGHNRPPQGEDRLPGAGG